MSRILIIEDDASIRRGIREMLLLEHFAVVEASSGTQGFDMALQQDVDLIILDLVLPGKNGEQVCADLRSKGIRKPVIMLTSKSNEVDVVLGLELGADDYLTKPFSSRELLARIRALLRRTAAGAEAEEYRFGEFRLDLRKQELFRGDAPIDLTVKEFDVLKFLVLHEGEVVTREALLNAVWGYNHFPTTRTVDNCILALRKKLEPDRSTPKYILTIHTAGYKFKA